jgi:hypothetical protein
MQYNGTGCKVFGSAEEKYKFRWSVEKRKTEQNVLVRDELVDEVIEVKRVTPRIMKVKMVMGK